MEIYIDIWVEDRGNKTKANEAIYTFVAVDTGRPVEVPQIIPETELEKQRFEAALRRKQLSLVLAGKLNLTMQRN
jgi:acyl-CoA hydrolase